MLPPAMPAPATPGPGTATAPAQTPAAPPTPAPLGQQLARPLFSLASAGRGTHTVTVTVAPEALGPVTVRAHVSSAGMQVEMFAGSDAARDAVRAIIPDLRRDMGGAGLQVGIDLSSQNQPSDARAQSTGAQPGNHGDPGRSGQPGQTPVPGTRRPADDALDPVDALDPTAAVDPTRTSLLSTSLDVLA